MKDPLKLASILFATAFAVTSLATTPAIDRIQLENNWQYPLFYASILPPIHYLTVAILALLALLSRHRSVKLLSVMFVALLVELTPSLMLENPWLPDQYPYLMEAAWLVRNGHTAGVHHLDQTPGLALIFSQLMLMTGLGPFEISKLYPLLSVLVTPLMFLTGESICGDGAIPSLLFFGLNFHQPNVFHRNSIFVILFVVLLFLIVKNLKERKPGYPISYTLAILAMVISYPGTIVPILSLTLVTAFAFLSKGREKVVSLSTPVLLAVLYFSWYAFTGEWEFGRMVKDIYYGLEEFVHPTAERMLEITAYGGGSYTEMFRLLIDLRVVLTVLLAGVGLLSSIRVMLMNRKDDISGFFISSMFLATSAQFVFLTLFIYYGLPTTFKFHTFFVYVAVLCVAQLIRLKPLPNEAVVRFLLGFLALASLLLVPLLSYPTIPFLHTPSSELRAKIFLDTHYRAGEPVLATELNLAYYLSFLLTGAQVTEPGAVLTPQEPIRYESNYLILQRFATRDGYLIYPVGYKGYLNLLMSSLSPSHDISFASGPYTKLLIKASNRA